MSLRHWMAPRDCAAAALIAALTSGTAVAHAASFQDIYDFKGGYGDGQLPESSLVIDGVGRLVGTTPYGGADNTGVVFRVTPPAQAGAPWTEQVLYDFGSSGSSALVPYAPVVLDGDSAILGTAVNGGQQGGGVVFRLDDIGSTQWAFTTLHSFTGGDDGLYPRYGVTFGPSGLLYGPASGGGANGEGALYSVSPFGDGTSFDAVPSANNTSYYSRPTAVSSSRLLFTTFSGGSNGYGSVVAARPTATGGWRMSTIFSFANNFGGYYPAPNSPLLLGPHQVLYGCANGGMYGHGVVYQLTPPASAGAAWTESVLYTFGTLPDAGSLTGQCFITGGPGGRIVGVTTMGGIYSYGALFKLEPPAQAGGTWTETILHNFDPHDLKLNQPVGAPLRVGNIYYGTAMHGGDRNAFERNGGGIWSFKPQ